MADTIQIVSWAIAQGCRLRESGESVFNPSAALGSLGTARAYNWGRTNRDHGFGVFGDVYVGSTSSVGFGSSSFPCGGFVISEEFARVGGAAGLAKMCHDCPANPQPDEIAQCAGTIYQPPESKETERQVRSIVLRRGLQGELEQCFPKTNPLWYGLWATSPIPERGLAVLADLFTEMLAEDQRGKRGGYALPGHLRELSAFIDAIALARRQGLQYNVKLAPPGHTDFGYYTIFPHCPFCKAQARSGRWQRRIPKELQKCHVCGRQFSPADNASSKRYDFDGPELRKVLGEAQFGRFARDYLIARGHTPEEAARFVDQHETAEQERQEEFRRKQQKSLRQARFLDKHIFVGLERLPPPPDMSEDDNDPADTALRVPWFNAENTAEVLRRCAKHGVEVTGLMHRSSDGDRDRSEFGKSLRGIKLLKRWRSKGCDEWFLVTCRVPDSLLDANPKGDA